MWWCKVLLFCVAISGIRAATKLLNSGSEEQLIKRVIKECNESKSRITCFSEKTAKAIEHSLNRNLSLFNRIKFLRNDEKIPTPQARSLSGFSRLKRALSNFLETHTFSVDLTNRQARRRKKPVIIVEEASEEHYSTSSGGGHHHNHHGNYFLSMGQSAMQKEKKYLWYAFMVLLGIFGLTAPIVMKTLAIIAGKALLASKAALIIVGSVALKKIFSHDKAEKEPTTVKVHTIPSYEHEEDNHDRISHNKSPYSFYSGLGLRYSPYSSYVPYLTSYNTPYTKPKR